MLPYELGIDRTSKRKKKQKKQPYKKGHHPIQNLLLMSELPCPRTLTFMVNDPSQAR